MIKAFIIDLEFFWTGERWESVDDCFAVLQRALIVGLAGYGGELWGMQ
jgi:hypothetical protein